MPFFIGTEEARRYARNRPYFHPLAITRAKKALGLRGKVSIALDVACGTGQSAKALTKIAPHVIGMDVSWNMLANAEPHERVRYVQARAARIPFQSKSMPIISIALAFHWFNRQQFLQEVRRVLIDEGFLLIYTNGFTGGMRENPAFRDWSRKDYQARFPTPPRDSRPLTPQEAESHGFILINEEKYENEVSFTPEEFVAYLTTQTNVVAAVVEGRESFESSNRWLLEQVRPYFAGPSATFVFMTRALYLRKATNINNPQMIFDR